MTLLLKFNPNGVSCVLIRRLLVLLQPDAIVEGHQGAGPDVSDGEGPLSAALYVALLHLQQLLLIRVSPVQRESDLISGAGQVTVLPGKI